MVLLVNILAKQNKVGVIKMKILAVIGLTLALQGCAAVVAVKDWIPSRWDVNQAKVITDLRQQTQNFDCKADHRSQLNSISNNLQWFHLYSESKDTKDVDKLLDIMRATVKEFYERPQPVSPLYCEVKRKLMMQQADIAAKTIQGRF